MRYPLLSSRNSVLCVGVREDVAAEVQVIIKSLLQSHVELKIFQRENSLKTSQSYLIKTSNFKNL